LPQRKPTKIKENGSGSEATLSQFFSAVMLLWYCFIGTVSDGLLIIIIIRQLIRHRNMSIKSLQWRHSVLLAVYISIAIHCWEK